MADNVKKSVERRLIDDDTKEEVLRYDIDYTVQFDNNLPYNVDFTKIVRTEFRDGKDLVEEIAVDDAPYFMLQGIENEELTGWV